MLISALSGCGNGDSMESFGGPTMGSTYSIKYVRTKGLPGPKEVQVEVENILADVDRQMSTYRSDSDIERFNDLSIHDLELGDIENINKKVKNYHLREYYKDDKLYFDYKLRSGVSTTRNALYLMKMAGLKIPSDIEIPK